MRCGFKSAICGWLIYPTFNGHEKHRMNNSAAGVLSTQKLVFSDVASNVVDPFPNLLISEIWIQNKYYL